jgi:hypothetical protein
MAHLPERVAYPFELVWYRKLNGQKNWHKTYRQPEQGVSLYHGSVGNDSILGKFTGLYGFIHIPIIRPSK